MPLPDAEPKPNKANIYEQFSHIKVQDFTRENLDVVRKPLNLNSESEDVLRRIKLVGEVSNQLSSSGPIPGTGGIEQYTQTSDANCAEIRPPKGEVWKIQGIAIRNTVSPTGTNNYYSFLSSAETLASSPSIPLISNDDLYYSVISSASTNLPTESVFEEVFQPFVINHNMFLRMWSDFENPGSGNEVKYNVGYIRLR